MENGTEIVNALLEKAKQFPPSFQRELLKYAEYLETKLDNEEFDGLLLSYEALAQSWLSPEDEEAWKDL